MKNNSPLPFFSFVLFPQRQPLPTFLADSFLYLLLCIGLETMQILLLLIFVLGIIYWLSLWRCRFSSFPPTFLTPLPLPSYIFVHLAISYVKIVVRLVFRLYIIMTMYMLFTTKPCSIHILLFPVQHFVFLFNILFSLELSFFLLVFCIFFSS